jgi:hypothetical protein
MLLQYFLQTHRGRYFISKDRKKMMKIFLFFSFFLAQIAFAQGDKILLHKPTTLAIDSQDNVFVGDGYKTYKFTPAGQGSLFLDAEKLPNRALREKNFKMVIDAKDNIYSIGAGGQTILKITPNGTVSDYVGNQKYQYGIIDGVGAAAQFSRLGTIAIGPDGKLYVTDQSEGTASLEKERYRPGVALSIRSVDIDLNVRTMRLREGTPRWFRHIEDLAVTTEGALVFGAPYELRQWKENKFETLAGLPDKAKAWLKSTGGSHYRRFVVGDISKAEFEEARQVVINKKGEIIFSHSSVMRILKLANNQVTVVAGGNDMSCYLQVICGGSDIGYKDGKASTALFSYINAMALDRNDNIYVVDPGNNAIRKISNDGMVSTFYK